MKTIFGSFIVIVAFAAFVSVRGNASVHSKSIAVEFPSDLPGPAQGPAEAMYLYQTGRAQAILYLEKDQGRKLVALDVSDPGHIKVIGQVPIAASSTYDFVRDLGNSVALIRYRNQPGFAVISFKDYKKPALTSEPDYLPSANVEFVGSDGLLLVSASESTKQVQKPQYQVLTISGSSAPEPLATIKNVVQRVDLSEAGTVFLLNDKGVTVVRRPGVERDHNVEEKSKGQS